MCSNVVVITSIGSQDSAQMRLAQDDDVIQTLTPDRSDQPFGTAILPRSGCGTALVPDATGAQAAWDDNAIGWTPVSIHIARSDVARKSLGYVTCTPLRRRVGCDVNPSEISAIKPYTHEAVEHSEANCRDNEQIHGRKVAGLPSLSLPLAVQFAVP